MGLRKLLIFGVAWLAAANAWADEPPTYHPPEYFASQNRVGEFPAHAKEFLENHPQDQRAAKVAQDLLMVATVFDKPEAVHYAQATLLLNYPQSLQNAYQLKTAKVDDLRSVLKATFQHEKGLDQATLGKFAIAIRAAMHFHGASFCDDELWAELGLAAQDGGIAVGCLRQMKAPEKEAGQLLKLVYQGDPSVVDQFIKLQGLASFKPARAYQRFLFKEKLSVEEKAAPGVRTVVIENLLRDQRFAEALPEIAALRETVSDARLCFWHGWSQAACGESAAAARTLAQLEKEFPDSPWAKTAEALQPIVRALDSSIAAHHDAFDKAFVGLLASPPEALSAKIRWQAEAEAAKELFVALDFARDGIDLLAAVEDKPLLAYRAATGDCRLFFAGESVIHSYAARGLCPTFKVELKQQVGGGRNLNFSFNTVAQGSGALQESIKRVLDAPWLETPERRRELLQYAVRSGRFPLPVEKQDGQLVLRWIAPRIDQPKPVLFALKLSDAYRVVAIEGEQWQLRDLEYGSRADVRLASPLWPALPEQAAAEFGAADFFRLFGALASLADTQHPDAARVAAEKAESQR